MAENKVEYIISLKDLFSSGIKKAKGETDELNNSVNNTSNSLGGLAKMAVGAFATIGIASFVKSVVEVGSSFESAEMGLKTFLGTSELAHSAYLGIQEDAQKTPFDFQSLLQANRALISSGESAEQARGNILNLANAIASTGGGSDELSRMSVNLQQIKNVGKASAMDIKQFAFAGINIYGLLADATGKNVSQVKDMEVSYDLLTYALQKAGQEGGIYYKGLENAMNTTQGKLSNLKDMFDVFKNKIFIEMKPLISIAINGLTAMMGAFGGMMHHLKTFSSLGKEFMYNLREFAGVVFEAIKPIGKAFGGLIIAVVQGISNVMWAFKQMGTTGKVIIGLTVAILALNYAMNMNPAVRLVTGIFAVIGAVGIAWKKFSMFRGVVVGLWEVVKGLAKSFWDLIAGFHTMDFGRMKKGFDSLFDVGKNFDKGYNKGVAMVKQPKKEKKTLSEVTKEKEEKKTTNLLTKPTNTETKSEVSKVQQKQATQIHINIGKLVETQNIKIENATKDFAEKLHNAVSEVLLNVINDANRIATQ